MVGARTSDFAAIRAVAEVSLFAACDVSFPLRVGFDEHPLMLDGRVSLFGEGSATDTGGGMNWQQATAMHLLSARAPVR